MRIILLAIIAALLIISPVSAQRLDKNLAASDMSQALLIAYSKFEKHIAEQNKKDTQFERFVSDISNYKITIYSTGDVYVVEFAPKDFQGGRVRGGGASYEVNEKTGKIFKFIPTR